MADQPDFAATWAWLHGEVTAHSIRLASEMAAAWADLAALLQVQTAAWAPEAAAPPPVGLAALDAWAAEPAQRLLFNPVEAFRRAHPQERALAALENYQASLEELVRRLPVQIEASGPELLAALSQAAPSVWRRYRLQRRRQPVALPLRAAVERWLAAEARRRLALDGECFLVLARGALLLLAPWQALRREAWRTPPRPEAAAETLRESRRLWLERLRRLDDEADAASGGLAAWGRGTGLRLAQTLLAPGAHFARRRRRPRREGAYRHWSRQQRAVLAVLDLECELARVADDLLGVSERELASLDQEQAGLAAELDRVIAWLRAAEAGGPRGNFPPPQAELVSCSDRAGAWERAAAASARQRLPAAIEAVEPRHALPALRPPWRTLEPQPVLLAALASPGHAAALEAFRQAEAAHRAVVREIERAREVVGYSLEAAQDAAPGRQIASEGIANALALLDHQQRTTADPHDLVDRQLAAASAGVLNLTHLSLDQGRLGLLAHLAQQSGSRWALEAWKLGLAQTAVVGSGTRAGLNRQWHRLLQKVGWEEPPLQAQVPVVARPYLGEVLALRAGVRDLPLIYQRLFRLAPLEEPRFMVGRAAEMAALDQARTLWQAQRPAAVLVVGARGSGKTSLLNCALAGEFAGATVVRGQFPGRLTQPAAARAFLQGLFGLDAGADIEAYLGGARRVVVIEELERAFLRRPGGFAALRDLLALMAASAETTLWMLSLNQHSYVYLDAAVGLGDHFTHRINAMAVSVQDLRNAVLLRHHLSGLRLEYPAPPKTDPRVRRLRRLLGLQLSREDWFFESLHRQSGGVFRSAFQLWQHHMDRVEGGVLYLREPQDPDYGDLLRQLSLEDALALQALRQHGSLTEQDHAEIFGCPAAASRLALARLRGIECLEPEPAAPGWRIRPEAGRLVDMALHRLNLN